MTQKIAFVTGANKGIGLHIASLLGREGYNVILGCRDPQLGATAAAHLQATSPKGVYSVVCVDIEDAASIAAAAETTRSRFPDGIDVLVNNAGFAYGHDSTEPFFNQAVKTNRINFTGTVEMCKAFVKKLKPHGRIVNVSSRLGSYSLISNEQLLKRWKSASTEKEVTELVAEFVSLTENNAHRAAGWPQSAYGVSKLAVTTYTQALGREYPNIHCYSCCPGFCKTDMTRHMGTKSPEDGADTPVWLASSAEAVASIPQGALVAERTVVNL